MPILHTALPGEGKPIRKKLGLTPMESFRGISIYSKENTLLVVSGVGKIPTAISLAYTANKYPHTADYFLNLGIAGSCRNDWELGSVHFISQVKDQSTERFYYPDLILRPEWGLAKLVTSDRPVVQDSLKELREEGVDLVDMEGSAFFQTALYFAESHRIHSIKIVSDYLEGIRCKAEDVERWMDCSLPEILKWLTANHSDPSPKEIPYPDPTGLHTKIVDNLLLSHSQSEELRKALISYSKRYQSLPVGLNDFLYTANDRKEKESGKIKLRKILSRLYYD